MTKMQTLTFAWKTIKLKKPRHIYDNITINEDNNIETRAPRLQNSETSLRWRMVKEWNSIPQEMKSIPSLPRFKNSIKRWLKSCRDLDTDTDVTTPQPGHPPNLAPLRHPPTQLVQQPVNSQPGTQLHPGQGQGTYQS